MSGAPSTSFWNPDHVQSLLHSGLKVAGTALLTIGIGDAAAVGHALSAANVLIDSIFAGIGAGLTLAGFFGSMWKHVG